MKKIAVLFFCLLFVMTTRAQKTTQSDALLDGYFTIGTGLSAPVGNFGNKGSNAYGSQSAANFDLNYTARFATYFGISIMARSVTMGRSVTNTEGYFNGSDPNYVWSAEATPNKIKVAMIGFYGTVPISEDKKTWLFFKPMLGASFVGQSSTTYNLIATEPGYNSGTVKITTGGESYAFAYQFALGIKYNITHLFAFMAQMDYTSTNQLFNSQSVIATSYRVYNQDATPYYLRMQMLSFNVGIALKVN